MIVGLGIDVVEVSRIDAILKKFGDRFLERILLPEEMAYCASHKSPGPFIAARFAAKEAVSKAFGTGIGAAIGWHDIEVRHKDSGEPYVVFHGKGLDLFVSRKANVIHLSLSHTAASAVAVAILEQISHLSDA
jgi:holo-[acyl-carrier protein] synthase